MQDKQKTTSRFNKSVEDWNNKTDEEKLKQAIAIYNEYPEHSGHRVMIMAQINDIKARIAKAGK